MRSPTEAGLSAIRKGKVIRVQRQLAEGRYDLDSRLDAVIDKMLDALAV